MRDIGAVAALGCGGGTLSGRGGSMMKIGAEWEHVRGGSSGGGTADALADGSASGSRHAIAGTQGNAAYGIIDAMGDMVQTSIDGANERNGENYQGLDDVPLACGKDEVISDHGEASAATRADRGGVQKRVMKRPYKKYYSNPTPSSHCHVCARTSKAVKIAVCARIAEGLCRKVTCFKCFVRFGWDWEEAMRGGNWVCVHCRGVCPEGRSQCYIYSRVNSKRERRRGGKKTKEGGG